MCNREAIQLFSGLLPNVAGVEVGELSRIELGNAYVTCEIITGSRLGSLSPHDPIEFFFIILLLKCLPPYPNARLNVP